MKRIVILLGALIMFGCHNHEKSRNEAAARLPAEDSAAVPTADTQPEYGKRLEGFLDSVGQLPAQPLLAKAAFFADSLFHSPCQLNETISQRDFDLLKSAAKKRFGGGLI